MILSGVLLFNACSDDDDESNPGNPTIEVKNQIATAQFGDSLSFNIGASDPEVPLSTLKARLYFGEEMVSETVIRTKTNGDYNGKIFIPYYKDIPNGTATLKFVLQNIHLTIKEETINLPVTRPDYPYLTLVAGEQEYRMERTGLYQYEAKKSFPVKVSGYIKAPAAGNAGNEITFGWADNAITQGVTANIPFSNSSAGEYAITFNTLTYEASPFIIAYAINDVILERIDDNNYKADLELTKGQEMTITGIDNISDWWIDPDFFSVGTDGKVTFVPISGKYRITANFEKEYFKVEAMTGNNFVTLQDDGSGVVWIIGDNIGKPSVATNVVGWEPNNAICMAPIGDKKYQVTLIAGKSVSAESINFKFFHQKGWGGEFGASTLTTDSDLIFVGDGNNGRDSGNLGIVEGKTLTLDATYVFTLDVSKGKGEAKLTVEQK